MDSSVVFTLLELFLQIPLISTLLKEVMGACGLKQKDLADILGTSLDRVKSLTSGRVKKLDPDETRRLVQTLNLNAHWLATGTGTMFNPHGGEQLGSVLTQLKLSSSRVVELGLEGDDAQAARDIATGVAAGNLEMVKSALEMLRHLPPPDEQLLLDTYRRCTPQARANLIQTAALLSAGMAAPANSPKRGDVKEKKSEPSVKIGGTHSQHASGDGSIQIGSMGSGTGITTRRR